MHFTLVEMHLPLVGMHSTLAKMHFALVKMQFHPRVFLKTRGGIEPVFAMACDNRRGAPGAGHATSRLPGQLILCGASKTLRVKRMFILFSE